MTEGFAAVGLHRRSRPENIGGVFRAADVYEVRLALLTGVLDRAQELLEKTEEARHARCRRT